MKKVIAIIGNQQKNNTYRAVREFEAQLRTYGEIEFEYIFLKDYRLEFCRGCKTCFSKGEEYCPLKDDRDVLIEKLESADGVIMATPNYAFHVSASMKNLLDRLAYVFHRPQFFGKTYTSVVNQGIHGGNAIVKYLSSMGENLGFQVTKGCVLSTMEPVTPAAAQKNAVRIRKSAARFYKGLMRPAPPAPTLFRLLMFRLSRTSIQHMLDERSKDYRHYQANGWFEAAYYYPVSLGPVKSLAGHLFDRIGKRMAKRA